MRQSLLKTSLLLAVGFLPGLVQAQEAATPMSVDECIEYAIQHKNVMKNIRLDEAIAKAKNREVTGLALPQVNGSGSYQYYIETQKTFLPGEFFGQPAGTFQAIAFTPKNNVTGTLTASQLLFDGSVAVALQARKTLEEFATINTQRTEVDIRETVSKLYYAVLINEKQLEILDNNYKDVQKIAEDNEKAYKIGVVEKIAVDQLKVQAANIQTEKIRQENQFAVSILTLKYQMGMPLDSTIGLSDTLAEGMVSMADLLEDYPFEFSQRPDYKLTETQQQLNLLDLKRYKWQNLPSLRANGAYGYNYASDQFSAMFQNPYLHFSYVGLNLNVPIFDGNQRRSRVKQANFAVEKTKNTLEDQRNGITYQQQQSRSTLKNAIIALQNQRANLDLAKNVYTLAQKKYRQGVGSNLEVIQTETAYLQAQSNFFLSLNAAIYAKIELQKALGILK
ncbi:TolC family protein [Taibaiella soli]|uniref:TolC family protein n=1 Tax=Taibaiella soli TaxID=1649169 RepID=A0A2W2AHR3_9BACT|nr:TolC family protein [Taibaiella soli]PZF73092.1 hypothetical protein DN068_09465 [Taibaiella soli]